MTDLDAAIAEIKRATSDGGPWHASEFGMIPRPLDAAICAVLNAVASGELTSFAELRAENARLNKTVAMMNHIMVGEIMSEEALKHG